MGDEVMHRLRADLRSSRRDDRLRSLERLHIMLREKGGDASVVPQLTSLLGAEDVVERRMASWALGKMAQNKAQGTYPVAALVNLLSDEDEEVRENAAWTLGELTGLGIGDESEIRSLNLLLDDPWPLVRGMAAWTLGRLAERLNIGHYSSLPMLRRMLEDGSLQVRKSAIYALERLIAMGIR